MEAISSFSVSSVSTPSSPITSPNDRATQADSPRCSLGIQASTDRIKPKQSKSRNGCITCKSRRLKCDEGKPGCNQCIRRKVACGGYVKDFKWRAFEDTPRGTSSPGLRKSKTAHVPERYSGLDIKREEISSQDMIKIPALQREFSSSCSSDSSEFDLSFVFGQPRFAANSPEVLALHFDRNTCGILSVRDGVNQNPWRTLIWPMAQSSPALYHAIASLSAFHCSGNYQMKLAGMHHVSQSISELCKNINNMSIEASLATSIALAFADAWDTSISTGKEHVMGGKVLIGNALAKMERQPSKPILRMLCGTWLYLDVLSRLTNFHHDEDDSRLWFQMSQMSKSDEIDPLLGCASTLFPAIGRVANIVRIVRETGTSVTVISTANELKQELINWSPPSYLHDPEDPSCLIQDSIQTAEAYRWATILLLHQACPELPSLSAETLAQKVLLNLATVPAHSRTVIVHIYPLLVASCEAATAEDRKWTMDRWQQMRQRMRISNLDRCIEIVKEVWSRRSSSSASQLVTRQPSNVEAIQNVPYSRTVRGDQHWSTIMKEFGWEVMLG